MFITPAFAQSLGSGGGMSSTLVQIAPLALIFVVFYFFLIRPQQQKAKQTKSMLAAIRRGDRVVTGGGLIATVAKVVNDEEVLLDLADGVRVRVIRSTIASVLAKTEPAGGKGDRGARDSDEKETEPAEAGAGDKAKVGGKGSRG
jgi:preprotein translocase subunit YajC